MKHPTRVLLIVVCLTSTARAAPIVEEYFEGDLSAWTVGYDLPDDPNNPGRKVDWGVMVSQERSFEGDQALELYIDGSQDDGTVWIARPISVSATDPTEVTVRFRFWSPFNELFTNFAWVVSYLGPEAPKEEADFHRLAPVNAVGEWDLLSFSASVPPDAEGEVWIALGFTVSWESEQTYYLDAVVVETDGSPPVAVEKRTWGEVKDSLRPFPKALD